jgi:hypothetical protein
VTFLDTDTLKQTLELCQAMIKKYKPDSKETKTDNLWSKLSKRSLTRKHVIKKKNHKSNIGPVKYRFRLAIFQIIYSIA